MSLKDFIISESNYAKELKVSMSKEMIEIENKYFPNIQKIINKHIRISDKFKILINNKIIREHTCDCCDPKLFEEAYFKDFGILLKIDANHPHDIIEENYTWEEVEQIFKENGIDYENL